MYESRTDAGTYHSHSTLVVLRLWVLRFLRFVDVTVPSSYCKVGEVAM